MKNIFRACCCLALCIALVACAQSTSQQTPTIMAESTSNPSQSLTPKPTVIPSPSMTLAVTAEPTLPFPEQIPDFKPTEIPGLFQSALTIKILDSFNGHNLQKITGWVYGFDGVEWMDGSHLLLYPIVGFIGQGGGSQAFRGTYPAAINIISKKVWVPASEKPRLQAPSEYINNPYGSLLPRWSAQLGIMIASRADNSVIVYTPDGDLIKTYQGNILGVSPSATKILINGNKWIDLKSGKTVEFAWPPTNLESDSISSFYTRPIWSLDETRVYACCYLFGDAKTGNSFSMPRDNITVDGKKVETFILDAFYGTWVMNNAYMLVQAGGVWDGRPNFVPLFDPASKSYRNLNAVVGIPYSFEDPADPYCRRTYAATGGRYLWMDCNDQDYLMDLTTFKTRTYSDIDVSDIKWSANGNFALVSGDDTNRLSSVRILSVSSGELKISSINSSVAWHPTDDKLAYLSNEGQVLSLLDASTMTVNEATLPITFQKIVWSPNGEHIALLAKDTSVWQIDYPTLQNLEQLAPAVPGITLSRLGHRNPHVQNLIWSPDSTSLAYIGNMDVYIVDSKSQP